MPRGLIIFAGSERCLLSHPDSPTTTGGSWDSPLREWLINKRSFPLGCPWLPTLLRSAWVRLFPRRERWVFTSWITSRLAHFGPVEGRASITQIRAPQPLECRMWAVVTPECTLAIQQFFKAPDWPNLLLYAFHPIALILQVIRRIREQNHRVLLVTPLWRNQHWFAELARLLTAALWPIPLRRDLLSQENGTIWLPQPEQWVLHLWPLNGSLRAFPKECAK